MQNARPSITPNDVEKYVKHEYADSNGVKIHYVSMGEGPLVVMVHGFPDFWYTWRHQMVALALHFQVVALDLRGYNLSDKPTAGEQYSMRYLIGDVEAVIRHTGHEKAILVGHDWGGSICWQFATDLPALTERLIILNMLHHKGRTRMLAKNAQQRANSAYARQFQEEGAHKQLSAEMLTDEWLKIKDPVARAQYIEAFRRSSFEGMLHYYKQNYPRPPYQEAPDPVTKVQASVLQIHGLDDKALLADGLNNTWEWLENDWTLLTIPGAGHFVQRDAADLVTRTMLSWLHR
ncbi:alpha/beta fold hydrolase [Dictyobacter aurantiacus]|uniref:Epoxide hydrolase n=1 Tax=Dictyobacter aurantiacus TaxID=1936993 RepID=A0A401ZR05_9CHLR|nr:alpha/beta hydrolase [Dictyobacter aurantiacus]GCE09348.1 epoxide hydrolase [Dictyobacter aurantiacus]